MISDEQVEVLREELASIRGGMGCAPPAGSLREARADALSAALDTIETLPRTKDGYRVTGSDIVFHDSLPNQELDVVDDGAAMAYTQGPHYDGDQVAPIAECFAARTALESEKPGDTMTPQQEHDAIQGLLDDEQMPAQHVARACARLKELNTALESEGESE